MPRTPVVMPKMSMTMTEGEVVEVLVSVGQHISAGDVVAVVGTDKTDMEVESDFAGEVVEISCSPGQVLEVGAPLFVLETEGEDLLAGMFETPAAPAEQPAVVETAEATLVAPIAHSASADVLAMPGARKLAAERGIDLSSVVPASPAGVIKQSDIPAAGSRQERARAQVAQVVNSSLQIPQFSITKTITLPRALSEEAAERFVQLATAWAKTLSIHQKLSQQYVDGEFRSATVRIAALVKTDLGYVSAAIDADVASPDWPNLARQLIADAESNRIPLANLGGATTSITDLSEYGITSANTLLLPPQSSAITIGSVRGVNHEFALDVTVVLDHRLADPVDAASALVSFEKLLGEQVDGNR